MLNMMSCKLKRFVSIFALAAFLIGPLGAVVQCSTASASAIYAGDNMYASRHSDRDYRDWKNRDKKSKKGHSTGEVVTGVIVGGVIGAIIAKNT